MQNSHQAEISSKVKATALRDTMSDWEIICKPLQGVMSLSSALPLSYIYPSSILIGSGGSSCAALDPERLEAGNRQHVDYNAIVIVLEVTQRNTLTF